MLSSTAFSDPCICMDIGRNPAAFFYLCMSTDAVDVRNKVVKVQVYAVGDAPLSGWKPPVAASASTTGAQPAAGGTAPVKLTALPQVIELPHSPKGITDNLYNILRGRFQAIHLDHAQLVPMIRLAFKKALAPANSGGSSMTATRIQVAPADNYNLGRSIPLWVVHW